MFHAENRFAGPHDLDALAARTPALTPHLRPHPTAGLTIDWQSPEAVQVLNCALLESAYGLKDWRVAAGHLCPAVPGRMEYLVQVVAALGLKRPVPQLTVLDVGTGAAGIYAVLAAAEWGWEVVASDVDPSALEALGQITSANPQLAIHPRLQPDPAACFAHVIGPHELIDLTVCNPPFYADAAEARRERSRAARGGEAFAGTPSELICPGGEHGFLHRMAKESQTWGHRILWFSSLVAQNRHATGLTQSLKKLGAADVRVLPLETAGKRARVVLWTFQDTARRREWMKMRWN
jgi:23S rRNA (adenine1618-N6)-methyltransferase